MSGAGLHCGGVSGTGVFSLATGGRLEVDGAVRTVPLPVDAGYEGGGLEDS